MGYYFLKPLGFLVPFQNASWNHAGFSALPPIVNCEIDYVLL